MKDANDWVAQPHPEDVKRIEERRFVRLTDEEKNVLFNRVVMEGLTMMQIVDTEENQLVEKNT